MCAWFNQEDQDLLCILQSFAGHLRELQQSPHPANNIACLAVSVLIFTVMVRVCYPFVCSGRTCGLSVVAVSELSFACFFYRFVDSLLVYPVYDKLGRLAPTSRKN